MLIIDNINFPTLKASARLVNSSGETLVSGDFTFNTLEDSIAQIRQAVRPQIVAQRDAIKANYERMVIEVTNVDAT